MIRVNDSIELINKIGNINKIAESTKEWPNNGALRKSVDGKSDENANE